jgi:hypothetical protein
MKIVFVTKEERWLPKCINKLLLRNELHNFCSLNIIRMIKSKMVRWAGRIARMGAKRNKYLISVGKPEGKRPLGRLRRRWGRSLVGLRAGLAIEV